MVRRLCSIAFLTGTLIAAGCLGGDELGPVDASAVPDVPEKEIEEQMKKSAKYLPKGAKIPKRSLPGGSN